MKPVYVELYEPESRGPLWHGVIRFATVEALMATARHYSARLIFRVLLSTDATPDEVRRLEQLGAVRA